MYDLYILILQLLVLITSLRQPRIIREEGLSEGSSTLGRVCRGSSQVNQCGKTGLPRAAPSPRLYEKRNQAEHK